MTYLATFLLIIALRYYAGRQNNSLAGFRPDARPESAVEKVLNGLSLGLGLGIGLELLVFETNYLIRPDRPWLMLPLGGYLVWFFLKTSQPMDRNCTATGLTTLVPGLLLWGVSPRPPDLWEAGIVLFIVTFGFGIWRDLRREANETL